MKSTTSISIAALALLFQTTTAHTWAEELRVISRNGAFTPKTGYQRGFVPRNLTGGVLDDNLWELQNIIPNDATICNPKKSPVSYPNLSAAPGDFVAIRYMENGHVTEPTQAATGNEGKGMGSGLVYVYGTADSKPTDTYNSIHKVWNKDGTGGDKRGKLLSVQYFDDMACFLAGNTNGNLFVDPPTNKKTLAMARQAAYQKSPADPQMGENLWCQTDFQIPKEAQTNKDYSIYWVWDWPTMDQTTGKQTLNQTYTICADIAISGSVNNEPIAYVAPQDLNHAARWDQMVNPFVVDPTAAQKPWSLRVTTDLFATPTVNGFAGSTTAHVQPSLTSSVTQQTYSMSQQKSSTTQQAATATSVTTQQGFVTVTVYVTQTPGVAKPTGVATAAQAGVGAPSSVASASSLSSGVASASGSHPSVLPFMKRSLRIRGRNMN